jgi:hypothetical protein
VLPRALSEIFMRPALREIPLLVLALGCVVAMKHIERRSPLSC